MSVPVGRGRRQRYSWSFLPFSFRKDDTPPRGQWSSLASSAWPMFRPSKSHVDWSETMASAQMAAPWYHGMPSNQWRGTSLWLIRWLSPTCRACHSKEVSKILVSAIFPHLPTSGLETLGPINSTGISFLSELGCRLTRVSGDPREMMFLFQQVSLAVQRYNLVAFNGTFLVPTELD